MLIQNQLLMLKERKPRLLVEESGDESADSADCSALLQVTHAPQERAPPRNLSEIEEPSTSFLGNIGQNMMPKKRPLRT